MRFAAPASIALALTAGCLRFGYGPDSSRLDGGFDAAVVGSDGSVFDAAPAADGGITSDAGGMDAATGGDSAAAGRSGATAQGGAGGAAIDAAVIQDAHAPDSSGLDSGMTDTGTMDSGTADSGMTDSGTMDAGSIDSGISDPGTTDPVNPIWTEDCPGVPSVLFCDDFEGSLAKWDYQVHVRGSTAVTTDYKRAGSYSLRAGTSASTQTVQSQARRSVKAFGHRKAGNLWARYYYYLPSSVTLTDKFSSGVISEYEDPFFGFSVLIYPDGVGIESGSTSRKISTTIFPRNQWVCVEMHVLVDASEGLFEFFMDGAQIAAISGLDTLPNQGYTTFEVGVHYANLNQGPITTYTDDVKLGTTRLGCN